MRMRIARLRIVVGSTVLAFAGIVLLAGPAGAQSFLQNLFGIGQQPQRVERSVPQPGVPAMSVPMRPGFGQSNRETSRYSPAGNANEPRSSDDDNDQDRPSSGGKYRTVCVRACDGYYFPISNSVTRARFMKDAAQCRSSCGEDARLYYLPASSDNMSTMLDLAGRSYLRMPNAFKYRKSLIAGCSCKPMPWSEAELLRHKQYAAEAALAEAQRKAVEEAEIARMLELDKVVPVSVAQAMSRMGSSERPDAVANTEPIAGAPVVAVSASADAAADNSLDEPPAAAAAPPRTPARWERSAERSGDRAGGAKQAARAQRQPGVARVSAPQAGVGASWFPTSSQKYTWPGDAPRR